MIFCFETVGKKQTDVPGKVSDPFSLWSADTPRMWKEAVMAQFEIQFWHMANETKENSQRTHSKKLITSTRFKHRISLVSNHTTQTNMIHNLQGKSLCPKKPVHLLRCFWSLNLDISNFVLWSLLIKKCTSFTDMEQKTSEIQIFS
jgi:hypothetical protein